MVSSTEWGRGRRLPGWSLHPGLLHSSFYRSSCPPCGSQLKHQFPERPSLISQHTPRIVILRHGSLFIFLIALFTLCNSFYWACIFVCFYHYNLSPVKEGRYTSYFPWNLQDPPLCWVYWRGLINIHGIIVCVINEKRNTSGQIQLIFHKLLPNDHLFITNPFLVNFLGFCQGFLSTSGFYAFFVALLSLLWECDSNHMSLRLWHRFHSQWSLNKHLQ